MVPVPLLHNLKHNKVLRERVVLLRVTTENIPRVALQGRIEVVDLTDDFHSVAVRYGFMEQPNIPQALDNCHTKTLVFSRAAWELNL